MFSMFLPIPANLLETHHESTFTILLNIVHFAESTIALSLSTRTVPAVVEVGRKGSDIVRPRLYVSFCIPGIGTQGHDALKK